MQTMPETSTTEAAIEGEHASREQTASTRTGKAWGGLDPAEAARRSHAARREKRAAREAEAEFQRLTVAQRAAVALASEMDVGKLRAVVSALLDLAATGRIDAVRELRAWVTTVLPDDGLADPDADPSTLSPAHRARLIAQLVQDVHGGDAEGTEERT